MQDPATPLTPTSGATGVSATRGWLERLWSTIADRGRPYADVPAAALRRSTAPAGRRGHAF